MKFYELLKQKRREKNISQERLAEMIGVSKSTVYNWENQRNIPQLDDPALKELSDILKIPHTTILNSISLCYEQENPIPFKYDFLPAELEGFFLSKNEVSLMKLFYLRNNLDGLTDEALDSSLSFMDIVNYFKDIQVAIDTLKSLKDKKQRLGIFYHTLEFIVVKNKLDKLSINELDSTDICALLENYQGLIEIIKNYKEDEMYVTTNNKCFISKYKRTVDRTYFNEINGISFEKLKNINIGNDTAELLFSNKKDIHLGEINKNDNDSEWLFYLDNKTFVVPYIKFDENPYFHIYEEESLEDKERYEKEYQKYQDEYKKWKELCKLRNELTKTDSFVFPPDPPSKPLAYKKLKITNKGQLLMSFILKN